MAQARPSEWPVLFEIAIRIFSHFREAHGFEPDWSFGGGTALMLQIDHRESHDIDLFLDDPQLLPLLNPETQQMKLERRPDSYAMDGVGVLKLAYKDIGEIDFICCAAVLDDPTRPQDVRGHTIAIETPAEIIAKKVCYRGWNFQPRDMFDMAAVAEYCGTDYVMATLSQCGRAQCEKALGVVEKATPAFVETINSQLMVRESARHLIGQVQNVSRNLLRRTLSGDGSGAAAP